MSRRVYFKNLINNTKVIKILQFVILVCISVYILYYGISKDYISRGEIDTYVLPLISLEYRISLIMEPCDLNQARIDFPNFYKDIYEYDDLRESKVVKIDDDHWVSHYFPIYAIICLPAKIILKLLGLNQEKCFSMTASLLLILAIFLILWDSWHNSDSSKPSGLFLVFLILLSPIWQYVLRIGIESIAFCTNVFVFILWRRKKYKSAALISSLISMANPTVLGAAIVIFIDCHFYVVKEYKSTNISLSTAIKNLLLLYLSYIPFLIPFVFNYFTYGRISRMVAAGTSSRGDGIIRRFLAYFIDTNLGVASFAIVVLLLFIISFIYSLFKRKWRLFAECSTSIITVALFSYMTHINCGMNLCARYIIWTYPMIAFAVSSFLHETIKKDYLRVSVLCVVLCLTFFQLNYNGVYGGDELSNTSFFLLNNIPSLYFSPCPSTFAFRYGKCLYCYDFTGGLMYINPEDGKVRKILYYGNQDCVDEILFVLELEGNDTSYLSKKMNKRDNKMHLISIDPWNKNQFSVNTFDLYTYKCICKAIPMLIDDTTYSNIWSMPERIKRGDDEVFEEISLYISQPEISDEQYIDYIYSIIWNRSVTETEALFWSDKLDNGISRSFFLHDLFCSKDYKNYTNTPVVLFPNIH